MKTLLAEVVLRVHGEKKSQNLAEKTLLRQKKACIEISSIHQGFAPQKLNFNTQNQLKNKKPYTDYTDLTIASQRLGVYCLFRVQGDRGR